MQQLSSRVETRSDRASEVVPKAVNVVSDTVDELLRRSLTTLLDVLLDVEADAYRDCFAGHRDANGRTLVARNGIARARVVPIGPVSITVRAPRINDRRVVDGVRQKFTSAVLAPGKLPAIGGAYRLAWEILQGWATGSFAGVIAHLDARKIPGGRAVELALEAERRRWLAEPIADLRFVSAVADAIEAPVLEREGRPLLALVGVMPSGRSMLVALRSGSPSSARDWEELIESSGIRTHADEIVNLALDAERRGSGPVATAPR